jgi:hypothetical protein
VTDPTGVCWKRFAERADNPNFEMDDVTRFVAPALEQDCTGEMTSEFIAALRAIARDQSESLFKEDLRGKLDALRNQAGSGIGHTLLDNVGLIPAHDLADVNALVGCMTAALTDRAARGARQVEEIYLRESTAPRALNVRMRIERAIEKAPLQDLARKFLRLDSAPTERPTKREGLDEGVGLL